MTSVQRLAVAHTRGNDINTHEVQGAISVAEHLYEKEQLQDHWTVFSTAISSGSLTSILTPSKGMTSSMFLKCGFVKLAPRALSYSTPGSKSGERWLLDEEQKPLWLVGLCRDM